MLDEPYQIEEEHDWQFVACVHKPEEITLAEWWNYQIWIVRYFQTHSLEEMLGEFGKHVVLTAEEQSNISVKEDLFIYTAKLFAQCFYQFGVMERLREMWLGELGEAKKLWIAEVVLKKIEAEDREEKYFCDHRDIEDNSEEVLRREVAWIWFRDMLKNKSSILGALAASKVLSNLWEKALKKIPHHRWRIFREKRKKNYFFLATFFTAFLGAAFLAGAFLATTFFFGAAFLGAAFFFGAAIEKKLKNKKRTWKNCIYNCIFSITYYLSNNYFHAKKYHYKQ